jgi:transcriptional regulator GlxA family with amidase domain
VIGRTFRQPPCGTASLMMKIPSWHNLGDEPQSQITIDFPTKIAGDRRIKAVQYWILEHLSLDHTLKAMAGRAAMSVRHFARVFQRETGITPAGFIELARVNVARQLLEEFEMPLKHVATYSGFVNTNVMRAAFMRRVGVGPSLYRAGLQG